MLLEEPLVGVVTSGSTFASGLKLALEFARGRPIQVLVRPSWHVPTLITSYGKAVAQLGREHPNAALTFMGSTPEDAAVLEKAGLKALHVNKNAFVDERVFRPDPAAELRYQAVHIAQSQAFKRHDLAYDVEGLALVTYDEEDDRDRLTTLVASYRGLAYANVEPDGRQFLLEAEQVREIICRSRCGLVLSDLEGANNASVEYLLCGVPVITTPSQGGRDAFFDPRHVRVVEPTAEAVRAAVEAAQAPGMDPLEIRQGVLDRFRPHRRRLITWLSQLSGRDLEPAADENLWLPSFRDKLRAMWLLGRTDDGQRFARPLGSSAPIRLA